MGQTDSILLSTMRKLGGEAECDEAFEQDVIDAINSALMVCMQLGVGPKEGFEVTGPEQTWSDFLEDDLVQLQAVKTYVYMQAKLVFDPPTSSFVNTSMENKSKELEWRLNVQAEDDDI